MEPMEVGQSEFKSSNTISDSINYFSNIIFKEYFHFVKVDLRCNAINGPSTSSEEIIPYNWKNIYEQLEKEASTEMLHNSKWNFHGRIGPPVVAVHKKNDEGILNVEEGSLHVCSSDNFSSVLGNVCIFKGKWQYEVMLGTKGVMQIGWATHNCKFSKENGVGDTPDSYAYDGNRQRKWNVSTLKYGETWLCGDIISCLIDLNKGEISYLRNGRPLGVAFDNVKLGHNIAYFPAMSLAIDECMTINFGATPFHYPQENFQALQCPPIKNLIMSKSCLLWLFRIVEISIDWNVYKDCASLEREHVGKNKLALMLMANHIGSSLALLLSDPFVVESTLVPIFDDMAQTIFSDTKRTCDSNLQFAHTFIDYLMLILQEDELKKVTTSLISSLQSYHKRVAQTLDYFSQKRSLKILYIILSHTQFRKFCLKYILFENYRFYSFATINCIDKISLKNVPNINYYASKDGDFCHGDKECYLRAVNLIECSAKELEDLQIKVFKLMLTATDGKQYHETSRALFLVKFRSFLKQQYFEPRVIHYIIPTQDILSLFHRCFGLFVELWEEEIGPVGENIISPSLFYDGKLSYHEIQRLGGLLSHLQKTFHDEKEVALASIKDLKEGNDEMPSRMVDVDIDCSIPSTSGAVLGEPRLLALDEIKEEMQRFNMLGFLGDKKKINGNELKSSLLHFLDSIVMLYHHAGHKQIEKIVAQCDVIFDNVNYLEDLLKKKDRCIQNTSSPVIIGELNRSIIVMKSKLKDQSYQHAWNLATTLSLKSITQFLTLMKLICGTLKDSSKEGNLFAFVPEFYVETLTELCQDLRCLLIFKRKKSFECDVLMNSGNILKLFRPGGIEVPSSVTDEYKIWLMRVGEFLSLHFCDSRIVYADSKDSLIQALAGFVCHKPSLYALENMPEESQLKMVQSLLQPYENRAWAQNNWILVRFWKGKGFGFRFTKSPHLSNRLGPKPAHCEIPNIIQSSVPSPSDVFLNHMSNVLQNSSISTPFLNSLLNQLNWVFSEFIGMLQEIQNASNRPERVFIDSRQLRICATCFDLALALLRVLEMVVGISKDTFLDISRPNSQSLLARLCQLICQVLNRVSVGSGCFSHVVNLEIPGLETIHYFPILTAVTGILCQLLRNDIYKKDGKSTQVATSALLSEASFQITSLYPLLGEKNALVPQNQSIFLPGSSSSSVNLFQLEPNDENCSSVDNLFVSPNCECRPPKFCFRKYPEDIKNFEIKMVVDVIHHLENASMSLSNFGKIEDSDTFCTICYARSPDAKFEPCSHTSCITCITHYLMNKRFCFFCKVPIMKVIESATSNVVWTVPLEDEAMDTLPSKT